MLTSALRYHHRIDTTTVALTLRHHHKINKTTVTPTLSQHRKMKTTNGNTNITPPSENKKDNNANITFKKM